VPKLHDGHLLLLLCEGLLTAALLLTGPFDCFAAGKEGFEVLKSSHQQR
jgi:hypothetical protein